MSDSTKADLEAALAAHVADEYGDFVAHWTVVVGVVRIEDSASAIVLEAPERMASYVQRGLLHEAIAFLDAPEDDED